MNKPRLVPKISNRLTLNNTVLIISAGVGIFFLAFLGAFFYFNIGSMEKASAANQNYTSKDNMQGSWKEASTWNKRDAWTTDVPQNGGWYTAEVLGYVTYEATGPTDIFRAGSGGVLEITDTLFVKGDAVFTSGGVINVGTGGVLVIDGDLTVSGGTPLNNLGRVVVTGNLRTTGGARINNNAAGSNGFYTYGIKTQTGGSNYGTNHKNETDLQMSDPVLYDFVSSGGIVLLPIVLDYFKAQLSTSYTVLVNWGTVSEKENDFFTLEHSLDGKTFSTIAEITGAGDSNKKLQYSYEHHTANTGMNFYRLKQTDFNGDFEYFKIISVNMPIGNNPIDQQAISFVGPNPFRESFKISYTVNDTKSLEFYLTSVNGTLIYSEVLDPTFGENEFVFNAPSDFKPGVYIASIKGLESMKPIRLIKN